MKTYLAGSLFNEAEVTQRLKEGKILKENFKDMELYNPIEAPCNDKSKLPTANDIFMQDTQEILASELVIADISNPVDAGVFAELGIIWMCNYIHFMAERGITLEDILKCIPKKELIAHLSEIRKGTAHKYEGNHIPVGFNQYMIGLVENIGKIKDNFGEVVEDLKNMKGGN